MHDRRTSSGFYIELENRMKEEDLLDVKAYDQH